MPYQLNEQAFQSIKKAERFDWGRLPKKLLLNLLVFTPVTFAYMFIFANDSVSGAVYITIVAVIGMVVSSIIDCRYEMGFVWSHGIFMACWGISLVIAVLFYPVIFGYSL